MNAKLTEQVKTIAVSERFKQDAFFFCGNSTNAPDERLLAACEKYLDEIADGKTAGSSTIENLKEALAEAFGRKNARPKAMISIESVEDEEAVMMRNILEHAASL